MSTVGLSLKNNVDADDSLRYSVGKSKPSYGLKTACLFVLLFSFYQVVYPSLTYDNHKFRTWLNGLTSFGGLLILLIWAWVSIDNQEDIPNLKRHYHEGSLNSYFVFISSIVIAIYHCAVGIEMYVERNLINDYLQALWTPSLGVKLSDLISHEEFLLNVYLVSQVFVIIVLLIGARISFRSVESEEITMNRLLSLSAILISITSFIILYLVGSASFYVGFADVAQHYPKWLLESIACLSVALIIGAAVCWLSNHQKWRVGFASGGIIIGIAVFFQISLLVGSYHSALDVHAEYSSNTDRTTRLAFVSEDYLRGAGCPNKYTTSTCKNDEVLRWELGTNSNNQACLNYNCMGILGEVYAFEFLQISHALLINFFSVVSLLCCSAYFWHHGLNPTYKGDRKNTFFGIFMIFTLITFVVAKVSFTIPQIETYHGDSTKLKAGNMIAAHKSLELITNLQGYEDFDVDDQLINDIFDLIIFKSYKYMLFKLTDDLNGLAEIDRKYQGYSYDDFYETLKAQDYAIGLIWVTVENEDRLFVPVYISSNAPAEIQAVLDISDDDLDEIREDDTIGFVLSGNISDFNIDNILQKRNRVFRTRLDPTLTGYYDPLVFYGPFPEDETYRSKELVLPSEYFTDDVATAINWMSQSNWYKLIVTEIGEERISVANTEYDANFADVRQALLTEDLEDKPLIFFYLFQYENYKRPIAVLRRPQYLWGTQLDLAIALIDQLETVAIPVFPLDDEEDFDLDYLINFGCIPDPNIRIEINQEVSRALNNF